MRIQAVNAAAFVQSSTEITGMRVTAVRPCAVYFRVGGKGVSGTDPNVSATVYRGRTDGTPGSALTPTKLDTRDAAAVGALATFLDTFSGVSSGGTKVDDFTLHPQFHAFSDVHSLQAGEVLDIDTKADAASTAKIIIRAVVRDLV
jgi:hypothetical protein